MSAAIYRCLLLFFFLNAVCLASAQSTFFEISSPWVWTCEDDKCVRKSASENPDGMSNIVCKLTCYESSILWPKPTGSTILSKSLSRFIASNVQVTKTTASSTKVEEMIKEAAAIFNGYVQQMESNGLGGSTRTCSVAANTCATPSATADHLVKIEVIVTQTIAQLTLETDESYTLDVQTENSVTTVYITAETYFGARHAMETLSQLIAWDERSNSLVILQNGHIQDSPVFPHRGFSIDTARNYMDIPLLKRIIDGLSYNKMNVLHWHILDSNSFPFISSREPLMAIYGAYNARQVYRPSDIQELVSYAQIRGVKIIPEVDAPSHVGAGWDWGPLYGMGDLELCYGIMPWEDYCFQPPCGLLNPINDNVYKILGNIYKDMVDLFQTDMFHMGGDEVLMRCWNETASITEWMAGQGWGHDKDSFLKLWSHFQNKSAAKVDEAFGDNKPHLLLWSSDLTANGKAPLFLDRDRYVIQIWDDVDNENTKLIYQQGYKLVLSNADALYLDCGFSGWVGNGLNNWCSPYKGWKKIYDNSPRSIIENFGLVYNKEQFLGGETALWAEQSKGLAIEGKIWPRTAAFAERMWNDPTTNWTKAETRLLTQRERMDERGITSDPMQPEWCMQNDGGCYFND